MDSETGIKSDPIIGSNSEEEPSAGVARVPYMSETRDSEESESSPLVDLKEYLGDGRGSGAKGRARGQVDPEIEYVAEEHLGPDAVAPPLFNSKPPQVLRKKENPTHRAVVYLKAKGCKTSEIAEQLRLTPVTVRDILRQPWAQALLTSELQKSGRAEIEKVLELTARDSVDTLIKLRDDDEVPASVRRSAADSLLDRWMGKPLQQTVHSIQDEASLDQLPDSELALRLGVDLDRPCSEADASAFVDKE